MTSQTRRPRLGLVLPAALFLFAATDVGLRLLPARVFAFRTWEVATQYPAFGAPFRANGHFATARSHGDLVNELGFAWARPHSVQRRPDALTSDRYGFRNLPDVTAFGPITVVAIGSSFTVGAAVGDQETFPVQLSTSSRHSVYNAGGIGPTMALIDSVTSRFHMNGGTVVYEIYESIYPPARNDFEQPMPCNGVSGSSARAICMASQRLRQFVRFSPLSALLARIAYTVRPLAAQYTLRSGSTVILRPDMLAVPSPPPATGPAVKNLVAIATALRARHLRLILVLVPNKETVYGPLLTHSSMAAAEADDYLMRLERDVRAAGIEVVNMTSALRAFADARVSDGNDAYFADDSHWTACGIALAARAVTTVLLRDSTSRAGNPSPPCASRTDR